MSIRQLVRFGLGSGSAVLVALSAVMVPITLINGVLTARALGPADRGDYSAIVAFSSVLVLVATAGVSEIIILNAGSREAFARSFKLTWIHAVMLAVLFIAPASMYARNFGYDDGLIVYAAATIPVIGVIATQSVAQLIAIGEVRFAALARVVPFASQLVLTLLLLGMNMATLTNVLVAYWCATLISAVVSVRRVSLGAPKSIPLGLTHVRSFYAQLRNLSGSQIIRSVSSRADLVLVAWMLSSVDAGLYSVAQSPVMAGSAIIASLSPLVLKRARHGGGQVASVSVVLALIVALSLVAVAPPLVTVLYGEDYAAAAALLPYLAIGLVANVVFDVSLRLSQAYGAAGIDFVSTVVALVLQVTGVILLGMVDGIRGVAIANALGYMGGVMILARFGMPSLFSFLSPLVGARLIGDTLRRHASSE